MRIIPSQDRDEQSLVVLVLAADRHYDHRVAGDEHLSSEQLNLIFDE